jgi:hypothetical protein
MPNTQNSSSPQERAKERRADEAAVDRQLEKDADEMAEKGQEVQKQNEEDRGIFTK